MVRRPPIKRWLLVSSIFLLFTGCGLWSRRVKVGEQFTLRADERVVVGGTGLAIKLKGKQAVGHQWYVDGRPEAPYVSLIITSEGALLSRSLTLDEGTIIGDYIITLKGANPSRSDGGASCDLLVTRR
jgi:hypothetical protein